ncbi:hypothetical protein DL764_009112 [Monosporascus ibericus]|uniref:Uncharacterized protein n=1 Tax=Monosporascus ibericus TaxID=155417 RepID=A0A4Q4SYX0_9PEZI|nr:hypothetical protein DL764_009112 [Monosporascus ibericus]
MATRGGADSYLICLKQKAAAIGSLPCGHNFHLNYTQQHWMTDVSGHLPLGWLIAWALDRAKILAGPGLPLMLGRATLDKHLPRVLELLATRPGSKRAERQLDVFVAEFGYPQDALGELRRREDPAQRGRLAPAAAEDREEGVEGRVQGESAWRWRCSFLTM